MKISILTPNLSHNCLGRAYLLAKILQRHYEIEVIGPIFGDGVWKPVTGDKTITYKGVKISGRINPYRQTIELAKKIDGDVIYASKPLFMSFGVGILKKRFDNKPLILDIDDWEMGFIKENYNNQPLPRRITSLAYSAIFLYNIDSYWNNLLGEKLSYLSDEITTSNTFLKGQFGGTIVWHGRDTKAFDPKKFSKESLRKMYGIGKEKKIVMFFGSPRPHKGLEDLVKAVNLIKDQDTILLLVGIDGSDQYANNLLTTAQVALGNRLKTFGLQPFESVPKFLTMADTIVIPQKNNYATMGQLPAKIFDAMAMAKPIIATNVSDIPEILDGCGWIVEPEKPAQLAERIEYVLDNPEEAGEMGQNARQKCIERYRLGRNRRNTTEDI